MTATETEGGRRWAEAKIKRLTGGDSVTARFMQQDFFDFVPRFKLIWSGNAKPTLNRVDEAIRRRLNLVPFTVTVPPAERDSELAVVWPKTREQRCWVHKTANVLAKLPKSQQPKAKRALQEIWMAETKAVAELAFDAFIESYTPKYEKAADCLSKDRDALLAFYDFPAEHWKHLRTTNPIESTFATVRHRTIRSKGCLSNRTALAMVFKLLETAQKSWRRLDGHNQLPKLVLGVTFNNGIEVIAKSTDRQPTTAAA